MKCENSLVLLLEAERDELAGRGMSEVAAHVRECARCGEVAARLLADTHMLAAHVAANSTGSRTARRVVSHPLVFTGALAAAAVMAMLLMRARETHVAPQVRVQSVAVTGPAPLPAPTSSSGQGTPLVRIREMRLESAVAATPVRLVASQDVAPVTPIGDSNGVSVVAPAGMRSAVLATRNEKITVVWLY